jgi:hypothetical protein
VSRWGALLYPRGPDVMLLNRARRGDEGFGTIQRVDRAEREWMEVGAWTLATDSAVKIGNGTSESP